MSMGICPVLDSQPEYRRCIYDCGKDLVRYDEYLTVIARRSGVRSLMDFFCMSRAEAIEEIGEEGVEEAEERGRLQNGRWHCHGDYLWSVEVEWFVPAEGLKTVNTLLEQLRGESASAREETASETDIEGVLFALQDIQELLNDAERKQKRFHMTTA